MADGKSGIAGSSSESPAMEEAMVVLRPLHGTDAPDPAVTRRIAETVLNDVQRQTGVKPDASNVFEQLHSFSVRAPRTFIDALSHAVEVDHVVSNQSAESGLITPVRKRIVDLDD